MCKMTISWRTPQLAPLHRSLLDTRVVFGRDIIAMENGLRTGYDIECSTMFGQR